MALRKELLDEHWSYVDRYAAEMIARGPTLTDDGETPTGSVHILDLPNSAPARAFAFDEPNHQAGVYRDVLLLSGNGGIWLGTAALVLTVIAARQRTRPQPADQWLIP